MVKHAPKPRVEWCGVESSRGQVVVGAAAPTVDPPLANP
ncbi:hypothetical protein COLO4_19471 [Corchorus olitorius]|uniref:Uncharacterized protein n=1 Tax=Corchorus olitorius TaxID=93759 RepID=A0A1R3J572_9ROSI|nr:hypothetical protein COLO4_19471 [Corchorus olitorius]